MCQRCQQVSLVFPFGADPVACSLAVGMFSQKGNIVLWVQFTQEVGALHCFLPAHEVAVIHTQPTLAPQAAIINPQTAAPCSGNAVSAEKLAFSRKRPSACLILSCVLGGGDSVNKHTSFKLSYRRRSKQCQGPGRAVLG